VADGTIYLYFKNKDDILISLFEERMDLLIRQMREELSKARTPLKRSASSWPSICCGSEKTSTSQRSYRSSFASPASSCALPSSQVPPLPGSHREIIEEGQAKGVIQHDIILQSRKGHLRSSR